MPWSSMRTISPGSTSRTNSALDRVERARLARHAPVPLGRLAQHQRPDAPRVAAGLHPVGKQEQQAERPLQVLEHVRQRVVLLDVARLGQQVDDDLGVGRALENVPVLLVLAAEQGGVDQVAVVGDGDRRRGGSCASSGWALHSLLEPVVE